MKQRHLGPRIQQRLVMPTAQAFGAQGIDQQAHLHAGLGPLGQGLQHALAGGVGLKNVVLQMHMVLGLANGVHDGIKGARPANEQLHLLGGGQGQLRGIADQAHQLLQPRRRLGCAVAQMRQALAAHACFAPAAQAL